MRPNDPNQLAKQLVDITTGQIPDPVRLLPPRREVKAKPRRASKADREKGSA